MTDVYDLNLENMSNELPSLIDTKYGTLDSIQKSFSAFRKTKCQAAIIYCKQ